VFINNALNFYFAVMDDHHGLDEGKHAQTEESLSREGTRDGEHQPLLFQVICDIIAGA